MIVAVTLINGLMTYVTSDNALKIMLYFVGIIFVSRFTQGYIIGLATTAVSVLLFDLFIVGAAILFVAVLPKWVWHYLFGDVCHGNVN